MSLMNNWLYSCAWDIPALIILILVMVWIGISRSLHKKQISKRKERMEGK